MVDDSPIVRQGVRTFIEADPDLEIVGEASNGLEAVSLTKQLKPDVVLMDLVMSQMDGLEATRIIRKEVPQSPVLILTGSTKSVDLEEAITAGARGFLLKTVEAEELAQAIKATWRGNEPVIFPPEASHLLVAPTPIVPPASPSLSFDRSKPNVEHLTPREKEVLNLLAKGKSNKEIARSLYLSENTVKVHVTTILAKLEIRGRVQLALYGAKLFNKEES